MDDEAIWAMAERIVRQCYPETDMACAGDLLKVARAAIIETREQIAAWLEQYPSPMDDLDIAMRIREICAAIRFGQQFRKDV